MERLTVRRKDGKFIIANSDYARPSDQIKKLLLAIDRLAAYEDTGLGPEEITTEPYGCVFYCNRKCNLDGDFCAEGPGCPHELMAEDAKHLFELAQAEKDGRLVVLPCKLHEFIYYLEDGEHFDDVPYEVIIGQKQGEWNDSLLYECEGGFCFYAEDIGKTIFLTREEAEAALKKRGATDG